MKHPAFLIAFLLPFLLLGALEIRQQSTIGSLQRQLKQEIAKQAYVLATAVKPPTTTLQQLAFERVELPGAPSPAWLVTDRFTRCQWFLSQGVKIQCQEPFISVILTNGVWVDACQSTNEIWMECGQRWIPEPEKKP